MKFYDVDGFLFSDIGRFLSTSSSKSFQNLICVSTFEPFNPKFGVLRPPIKVLVFTGEVSIKAIFGPFEVTEAPELRNDVDDSLSGAVSNENNGEFGALSIVKDFSQDLCYTTLQRRSQLATNTQQSVKWLYERNQPRAKLLP